MNERIFDMARQKGATDEQGNRAENVFCFTKDELKAFAELIVRECCKEITQEPFNAGAASLWLKDYFGVKE